MVSRVFCAPDDVRLASVRHSLTLQKNRNDPWPRQEMLHTVADSSGICGIGRAWRRGIFLAYALVLAILLLAPSRTFADAPRLFQHQDKVVHVLLYAALAGLGIWSETSKGWSVAGIWVPVAAAITYGAVLEMAQEWIQPGDRCFSWGDIAANAVGAFLAAFVWLIKNRRLL